MEVQMTSKENSYLVYLATKTASLFYQNDNINFYIPISYVDANFERAQKPNAIIE
jgi:hypothetical protein